MNFETEELPNATIVNIKGEFYVGNVARYEEFWQEQIKKKPNAIVFNCKELVYIDSSAIGTLVKFLHNATSEGVKLQFFNLNPSINNIFQIARLDKFFTITTREEVERNFM